jgi:alpha-glucoside transport system permease protein
MTDFLSSVPALLLVGSLVIPALIYAYLGTGEAILERAGLQKLGGAHAFLWLLVPLALVTLILVYPLIDTVISAFLNYDGSAWVGLDNFFWAFSGEMFQVLVNNVLWIVLFPLGTVVLALVVALLFDKVKYERLAMTIVVLPTAISFTAASIIWRQFYSFQPAGQVQKGLLNAIWTLIPGAKPIAWLQQPFLNTLCLIFVAIWASLGVASLILSAAVKGVPNDYIEAARIDGAGEWRILFDIIIPGIMPALLVVGTTQVIFALKIFDIIYVMTNGNFKTNTLANRMYSELFAVGDLGHAAAIAVILLIVAIPVVVLNIRQFQK